MGVFTVPCLLFVQIIFIVQVFKLRTYVKDALYVIGLNAL